jgi:hypothetical protein
MAGWGRAVCAVILFGWLVGACTSPEDPGVHFLNYPIINGEEDFDADHKAACVVMGTYGMCTGTLISPRVVLTAAHCADGSAGSYEIRFGHNIYNYTSRTVVEKWVHPYYDSNALRNDIALMRLGSSAPSDVTPIPHLPASLEVTQSDVSSQTPFTFVGFGMTDPFDDYSSGVKMQFTDRINWVCTQYGGCNPGQQYTICQDQTPSGLCSGDSGGPALVERGGQTYVAGIASYVYGNCEDAGCSTKVDEFESDINDFIGGVLGASCTSSVSCDSGHCVDGVCCESACTFICHACNLPGNLGSCLEVPDGTFCLDNDLCNGPETCQNGSCVRGDPPVCANANPCTGDTCDPDEGCLFEHMPNGTSCSNGNPCDGEETCLAGVCQAGSALDCDDRNPCTADSCERSAGCQHVFLANGLSCGGGLCGAASCQAGECVSANTETCEDNDPCTRDWCNPDTGCVNQREPNGYACGECLMCWEGACVEAPDCGGSGCGCSGQSDARGSGLFLLLLMPFFLARRRS